MYALEMPSDNVLKKYYTKGVYAADNGPKKVKISKKAAHGKRQQSQMKTAPESKEVDTKLL